MEDSTYGFDHKSQGMKMSSDEPVCQNGCTVPCSWCYSPEERAEVLEWPVYEEAKGG